MAENLKADVSLNDFFEQFPDIKNQLNFAVAVSGGPDSMALAALLSDYSKTHKKNVHVITVDHGLRVEAAAEAQQVGQWVKDKNSKNITHVILNWQGDKYETGIMEAARQARYDLMAQYCRRQNIQTLFVAHHQDDQMETFFIRLAKGSGLDGLAGMSALRLFDQNLKLGRPLLDYTKQDLIDYCDDNKILYVTDPSNKNKDYLRPRLREFMSSLEEEGLSVKRISTLTKRIGRARNALENISLNQYKNCLIQNDENKIILNFLMLSNETEEIAFRVVHLAVQNMRGQQEYNIRMDRLEDLFESLWNAPATFKPRTLGGLIFALKDKNSALYIERESLSF